MRDRQKTRRIGPHMTRAALVLLLLLAAALIRMGGRAQSAFTDSGFSDGSGFDGLEEQVTELKQSLSEAAAAPEDTGSGKSVCALEPVSEVSFSELDDGNA